MALLGVWAVSRLEAEHWWFSNLLLYLPQLLYGIPLLGLLPICLLRKEGYGLLACLAAAALVLGPMMGFHLPRVGAAPQGATLRIMTYNIWQAATGVERTLAVIQKEAPDVLALQETAGGPRGEEFAAALQKLFPGYSFLRASEYLIASRYRILASEMRRLDSRGRRQTLWAQLDGPTGPFNLFVVHLYTAMHGDNVVLTPSDLPDYLGRTASLRLREAYTLVGALADCQGPVVVVGDLNTPPYGLVYSILTRGLRDAFDVGGFAWGFTYPAHVPLLRIDHILVSARWHVRRAWVGGGKGSDHRPVVADLVLPADH
ncbi:MAG: endonuclease/exonuclease/phosphatase family protein [Armatimonadetes bacterium]|nr:endonuclease/exonuclease/phosphatase family protein [Armatimonadota bacterium]